MKKQLLLILTFNLLLTSISYAQMTKIRGIVKDSLTSEPIPFANVFFEGTTIGATSDFNGRFSIESLHATDTLTATFIGFHKKKIPVRKYRYQEIEIILSPEEVTLEEIVVVAGENPADILFRKMIANKERNNNRDVDAWQAEVYNKIQFDANNFSDQLKDRRVFRQFQFIFDYVDTSAVNGKPYLPMFITEAVSEVFYRKEPQARIEKIISARGSGVENPSIAQFMGNLYQDVNIYDNYISLFGKNFVSPAAGFGMSFYRYYLVDSATIDGQWCYKLMYKPRRKQELTFNGYLWLHDTTFAIKEVEMVAAEDANLNFINDLTIRQQYSLIDNRQWMLTRDYMMADFNVVENTRKVPGFFGQRTTTYRDYILNQPVDAQFYRSPVGVIVADGSLNFSDEYWDSVRPEKLSERESRIYSMIDSIENVPIYKTYVDVIYMVTHGYAPSGKFEIGPIGKMYGYNEIEGHRFRFGGRTSNQFSRNLRLHGFAAYGIKDQKPKYGGGLLYVLDKSPLRSTGFNFRSDTEQLGASQKAVVNDNFLSVLVRRQPSDKLNYVDEYSVFYEHEWFNGLTNKLEFTHREIKPAGTFIPQTRKPDGELVGHRSIVTSELSYSLRFAFRERSIIRDFDRISFGTKYPEVNIRYSYSGKGILESDWEYHRLEAGVTHWFHIGPIGWMKYTVEAGQLWGKLPFPLLMIPSGNETFIYDQQAYNLMNYYEFVNDSYASLYLTHHFDGFFFNRIPLLRKLKWREVVFVKGLAGKLSDKNRQFNMLPDVTNKLDKPYAEAGAGIENIFKIVRVDGIWRLSHRDHKDINNFALFVSLQFSF